MRTKRTPTPSFTKLIGEVLLNPKTFSSGNISIKERGPLGALIAYNTDGKIIQL